MNDMLPFWGVIGTWLSGLATVAAVIVSLWLAYRRDKVRLSVAVKLKSSCLGDSYSAINFGPERILLEVHNNGTKGARICSVQYESEGCKTINVEGVERDATDKYWSPQDILPDSDNIPKTIGEAESARYYLPFCYRDSFYLLQKVYEMSEGRNVEKCIKRLKIGVKIGNGESFSAPVGNEVQFFLLKQHQEEQRRKSNNK